MSSEINKELARIKRHIRVRKKVFGTPDRPRLCVHKSLKHIYAQIIDDQSGRTLLAVSSLSPDVRDKLSDGGNIEAAKVVGEVLGKKALENNISAVVFDRGGYLYHGRIKALADSARAAGLNF